MTVNVYKSTDGGAPSLTGEVGSLIAVLDWALVTGSGWTKEYTDTNRAVYRHSIGQSFFKIVDNGTETYGAEEATIRGYMTMGVDMDTDLTNEFPTVAQRSIFRIKKSGTADSTARDWCIIEEGGFVIINITTSLTYSFLYMFGKFISETTADSYNHIIAAGTSSDATYGDTIWPYTPTVIYTSRSANQSTESVICDDFVGLRDPGYQSDHGTTSVNENNGKITLFPFRLSQEYASGRQNFRITVPGCYYPFEYLNTFNNLDTFSIGSDTYIIFANCGTTSIVQNYICVKTNGTWW